MLIKMLEDDNLENIKRKVIILYLVLSSLCIFSLILKVIIYLCKEIVNRSVYIFNFVFCMFIVRDLNIMCKDRVNMNKDVWRGDGVFLIIFLMLLCILEVER